MWEELHPEDPTLKNAYESQGTFAIAPGTSINGNSPLAPFVGAGNRQFSSQNVIDVTTFGYTYPDLPKTGSADDRRRQMITTVNKLYGRDSGNKDDESSSAKPSSTAPASQRLPNASASGLPTSIVSLSSAAETTASSASEEESTSLPASGLPTDGAISLPASIPTASVSKSAGLGGLPSATLTSQGAKPTSGSEDDDDKDSPLDDLPSFGEIIPGAGGNQNNSNGLNMTDLFPPIPDDLIPDIPDLDVGIDCGIEYNVRIKINAGKIPVPSEMNVYIGEKFAGSFAVLSSPPSGCIEGEFPIRKVLDILGLLGGLISDLIHGKIQNPIDAIKDDINVEFVSVRSSPWIIYNPLAI